MGLDRLARERELPPGQVVVAGVLSTGVVAALSIGATGRLSWMFVLGFILICITLPLAASDSAMLTTAVLPPLLMLATSVAVAASVPEAIEVTGLSESAGLVQRAIAGFVDQSTALALGTVLTLAGVGLRMASRADRRP